METVRFDPGVSLAEARELYRAYKKHRHYDSPVDAEIQRIYQLVAQGRVIIKAIDSIVAAGLNEQKLPKLALTRATAERVTLNMDQQGGAIMQPDGPRSAWDLRLTKQRLTFPPGSFPGATYKWSQKAVVPLIPAHLRPKRGLANYHILWEAEWQRIVPRDPMLLRRIGRGDLWLVCAAWDLTEVERAVLAQRLVH